MIILLLFDIQNNGRKARVLQHRRNPLEIYTNGEFEQRFRFQKETFNKYKVFLCQSRWNTALFN